MSFKQVKSVEERKKLVDEFLKNRGILKKRQIDRRVAKQDFQEDIAEPIQKPLLTEIDKQQDKLIEQLDKGQKALVEKQTEIVDVISNIPYIPPAIRAAEALPLEASKKKEQRHDIFNLHKNIDTDVLMKYGFPLPSDIYENYSGDEIDDVIEKVNKKLKSIGGFTTRSKKRREKGKLSTLERETKALQDYKDRLNLIVRGTSLLTGKGRRKKKPKNRVKINWYKTPDELCERLQLLISSKEAGNEGLEIDNEIVEILKNLLNEGFITKKQYKSIYNNYI